MAIKITIEKPSLKKGAWMYNIPKFLNNNSKIQI